MEETKKMEPQTPGNEKNYTGTNPENNEKKPVIELNKSTLSKIWQAKKDFFADVKEYFRKSSLKKVLVDFYNHPSFRNYMIILVIFLYSISAAVINSFFISFMSIGSFEFSAPAFGYSEFGLFDVFLMILMVTPIMMLIILTKNSFQNLAPEGWSSTTNRFANQAKLDNDRYLNAGIFIKSFINIKRIFRFLALLFMFIFSKLSMFALVWGFISYALYVNFEFFTWWRILLLTFLAVILADRIWVDITRWFTNRIASNVSSDGGDTIATDPTE